MREGWLRLPCLNCIPVLGTTIAAFMQTFRRSMKFWEAGLKSVSFIISIISITFLFLSSIALSQTWMRSYGFIDYEVIKSVQQTDDGGFIAAGWHASATGGYDFLIMKLDNGANITWKKRYGETKNQYDSDVNEEATIIRQTADQGYIVAGYYYDPAKKCDAYQNCQWNGWIMKLDSSGNIMWQKHYGLNGYEYFNSIQQISDGGYIVAGTTGPNMSNNQAWILRLNSAGDIVWQKAFEGPNDDRANSIVQTIDGNILVSGWTNSYGAGDYDVWVMKVDLQGDTLWQKTYGGALDDRSYSSAPTADGGAIIAGLTYSFGAGSSDYWLFKIDSTGAIEWQKRYGGSNFDYAYSVKQTFDGGYIVAGCTVLAATGYDGWLLKLDSTGTIVWQEAYGSPGTEYAYSVDQTSDEGFVVAGQTNSFGSGAYEAWIFKVDSTGQFGTSCSYANPTTASSANTSAIVANTASGVNTSLPVNTRNVRNIDPTLDIAEQCANWQVYDINCDPSFFILDQERNGISTCTVHAFDWSGAVTLSCANLPPGASCIFNPQQFALSQSESAESTLTVSVANTEPSTSYFQAIATSGAISKSVMLQLKVLQFDAIQNPTVFGDVPLGQAADKTIILKNVNPTEGPSISMLNITSPSAPFTIISNDCSGTTLPPGLSCTLQMRFAPTVQGPALGNFTITSSALESMTVDLLGAGITPEINISVMAPNGGESWDYSPSTSERRLHLLAWDATSFFPLAHTKLYYSANAGTDWTCIADSNYPNYHSAGPIAIPDNDPAGITSDIAVSDNLTLSDVNVRVLINHPRVNDLTLSLIGPDATEVILSNQTGVSGSNYADTIFDDETASGIDTATAPYNGFYKPDAALTAFDGKSSISTWKLKAVDAVTGETGTIDSWTINFSDCSNHILGGSDVLLPTDKNFIWEMPTKQEAATSVHSQTLPSATARIKVESWDPYANHGEATSNANFYIVQPTTTSIKTLVVWDSKRICERFDQSPPDPACTCASATTDPDCNVTYSLSNKLIELKDHEKVSGVVLDLAAVPAVQAAYAAWDAEPLIITHANDTASAIRDYLMAQANNTYTNTQYLILVGNDHQVPFYRLNDGATIYPESEYPAEVGLNTGTPVGFALSQGYFLTDNYYSELTPEASGMPTPHEWVYQNDFATGRLVETPEQIEGLINTFLAQNGQVNALPDPSPSPNKKNRVLVTGLDFLHDGATKNAQEYDQRGYTPAEDLDTLIDDPAPGQTGDEYTPAMLEAQLFPTAGGENMHYIANINTHANHYSFAASSGTAKLYCTDPAYDAAQCHATGIYANPKDLKSSVLYTSGCHSGLNVDDSGPDTKELDLPEVMAGKGVVGYIGNTGYGWGLRNGRGLTETLMEKITDAILDNKSIAIGKALSQAKRNYFLNEKRWDVFDEKVMHELTLFGIPNYLVVTSDLEAMRTPKEELPLPEGPDTGCANGICLEKKLTRGGNGLRVPGGVMALDLNFTMCSGACSPCPPPACTYDLHQTADGYYYTLNTRASGEVGDTLQPQFIFNAFLSDINAHGVIFTGGHYLTDPGAFDPVIAVPRSTNDDSDEGPLPSGSAWTPGLRVSFGCAAGLGLRGNIGEVGYTNMLVYTGMCEDYQVDTCTQSRFKDMQFVIYYSNYSDVTAPLFATKGHTVSGLTATFTAEVTDASGVYRVLMTYRDKQESRWSTLELTNTTGDQWTGALELTGDTIYYWQAVDNAGNVGIPSASGPDKAGAPYPPDTPYGSTWSGPELGAIVLPDGDSDGLPDAYEDLHACLNKAVSDSEGDPDFDELTSLEEFQLGSVPCLADTDGDGDNDGSEERNAKDPFIAGDGDRLTLWPAKQAPGDLLLMWYRGTDNGTQGGVACDPGGSLPPCTAIEANDAIDGHFRVYISTDPRFSTNDYRIGPDGDLDDGATDLDQNDQREYLLVNSTLPAEYQSAPILYFQTLNWDILVNAPLIETVVRNGAYFTIFGQYFHATGSEALLCEAADTCDSPISMAITSQSDERIRATAPGGVTGTKYVAVRNPDGLMDIYSTLYPF